MIWKLSIHCASMMILLVEITSLEITENCTCEYYSAFKDIRPYCLEWTADHPPYCYLGGRDRAKNCPGAVEVKQDHLYWTEDKSVCNRSITPSPVPWSLNVRQPFEIREIVGIILYSLNILVGTVGNALVVKHFAFGGASGRPGSRFVIVLAGIDFTSSIWVPVSIIMYTLYYNPSFPNWNFGETTCRITWFFYLLFCATAWLLLAISLERARVVFRPFSDKLSAKVVIISSTVILLGSFALSLNYVSSFRYKTNAYTYVDGTLYVYSTCESNMSAKETLIDILVVFAVGIWLPMILIPIVYILMFLKLKRQAKLRQHDSTYDSHAQLSRISRTFAVVLIAFYVCYLPGTIFETADAYYRYFGKTNLIEENLPSYTATSFLFFTNSSLNPIIYSNIHVKICNSFRTLIMSCMEKWPCQKARTTSQPISLNNMIQSQGSLPDSSEPENSSNAYDNNVLESSSTS